MVNIYLSNYLEAKPKTIKELIHTLYSVHYYDYSIYSVKTFKDDSCQTSQCHNQSARTFKDLLNIVKTYFPKSSDEDLLKVLFKTRYKNKRKYYPMFGYCHDIESPVFYYSWYKSDLLQMIKYSYFVDNGVDKSWAELFTLINKDEDDYLAL